MNNKYNYPVSYFALRDIASMNKKSEYFRKGGDCWIVGTVHLQTKETRLLNRLLGLNKINKTNEKNKRNNTNR